MCDEYHRRLCDARRARGEDGDDERERATALVHNKLPRMHHLETEVVIRRLVGQLSRKGYSSALAYSVVREALDSVDVS